MEPSTEVLNDLLRLLLGGDIATEDVVPERLDRGIVALRRFGQDLEGLGEREFRIEGKKAWFAVRRRREADRKEKLELVEAHFERGLEVGGLDGAILFKAPVLRFDMTRTAFEAPEGMEARSPEGSMRADRVSGSSEREGHLRLDFVGATEMTYL